jgi:hypothetical protein
VAGGAILKFPQIYNLISKKSVFGLSFFALIFEVINMVKSESNEYFDHCLQYFQAKSI